MEEAMAGSQMYVYRNQKELDKYTEDLLSEFNEIKQKTKLSK